MNTYFRKIGRGLAGILTFNGRMAIHDFWPYAISLAIVLYAVAIMYSLWLFTGMSQRMVEIAIENPEAFDSYDRSYDLEVYNATMGGFMKAIVPMSIVSGVAWMVFLGAAIVRRLHDTGRTGLWALLPVPFSVLGVYVMVKAFDRVPEMIALETNDPRILSFLGDFIWGMAASLANTATFIILIIMLCGKSKPQADRFGPPPVPIS